MKLLRHWKVALDVLSAASVVIAGGLIIYRLGFATPPGPQSRRASMIDEIQEVIEPSATTNVKGVGRVAIIEFSDFECPFCASHARDVFPTIQRELIESGRVRYIVMNYPMERVHPNALKAAEAAECAGRQGRFWEMHDRLFSVSGALDADALSTHAKAIGLDGETFQTCLDGNHALARVRADHAQGARLGVSGTPAFFLGVVRKDGQLDLRKRINGVTTAQVFEQQVAELARNANTKLAALSN